MSTPPTDPSADILPFDNRYPTFSLWYARFEVVSAERGWDIGPPEEAFLWEEYWLDGDSPEEALEHDIEHS